MFACVRTSGCFIGHDHEPDPRVDIAECSSSIIWIQTLDSIENLVKVSWDVLSIPFEPALLDLLQLGEVFVRVRRAEMQARLQIPLHLAATGSSAVRPGRFR